MNKYIVPYRVYGSLEVSEKTANKAGDAILDVERFTGKELLNGLKGWDKNLLEFDDNDSIEILYGGIQKVETIPGVIQVFTGPMFCGKTLAILLAGEREKIAGRSVLAFKPKKDTRSRSKISSRAGYEIDAVQIDNIEDMFNYEADVYLIDEFQFLSGSVSSIVKKTQEGKRFYISGLNMTSDQKPFGLMPELLCCADKVEVMKAVCVDCGSDQATHSYFIGDKKEDILIGDDKYKALCRGCYTKKEEK